MTQPFPETPESDELPEWHLAELRKRRLEFDESSPPGEPWREVLARIEATAHSSEV